MMSIWDRITGRRGSSGKGAPLAGHAELHARAEAGDADAMVEYALLLVDDNPAESTAWLRRAADTGHPQGSYYLGVVLNDEGDVDGAREQWRRAADAGYTPAMHILGFTLYEAGEVDLAKQHWRRAVEGGNADSMVFLAMRLLQEGDADGGRALLERAAALGNQLAVEGLAQLDASDGRGS
ncbi:tetratricopeptide repeat protein [Tessaracoccus terricola]